MLMINHFEIICRGMNYEYIIDQGPSVTNSSFLNYFLLKITILSKSTIENLSFSMIVDTSPSRMVQFLISARPNFSAPKRRFMSRWFGVTPLSYKTHHLNYRIGIFGVILFGIKAQRVEPPNRKTAYDSDGPSHGRDIFNIIGCQHLKSRYDNGVDLMIATNIIINQWSISVVD